MILEIVSFFSVVILVLVIYIVYLRKRMSFEVRQRVEEMEEKIREDALERSRATIKGKVSEQLAPFSSDFDFNVSDARFIGSPVDYVIFDGCSDGKDEIEVIVSDVKTGDSAKLTENQKKIKEAVEENRVRWETIRLG